jgi:hypothetical protein
MNRPMGTVPGRRGAAAAETVMLDELVAPHAIHGIEVYQGLSKLPAEFAAMEGFNPVGFRYRGGVGERIVHMRSLIGTTGNVETSQMERGGVRGSQLERDIALHLRQFLFVVAETVMLDEMIAPGAIHGIEVYQGLSRLPPEFVTPEITCGVVAIWTRRSS